MLVWNKAKAVVMKNKAKAVVMKNNKEIRPLVHKIFPPKQNLGQKIILPNTLKEKNLFIHGCKIL